VNNTSSETKRKCNQCGEDLVLQKTTTLKSERSFAPMTQNTYRCSNKACQDEIDKRTSKRIELKNEQEMARQKRLEKTAEDKLIALASK
jgi:hypothetical protein